MARARLEKDVNFILAFRLGSGREILASCVRVKGLVDENETRMALLGRHAQVFIPVPPWDPITTCELSDSDKLEVPAIRPRPLSTSSPPTSALYQLSARSLSCVRTVPC